MNSGKWWEFYFVRYFVGSVFGALIVLALALTSNSGLADVISNSLSIAKSSPSEIGSEHFIAAIIIGTAFCYFASIPILVFHTLRSYISFNLEKNIDYKWRKVTVLIISIIGLWFLWSNESSLKFFLTLPTLIFIVFQGVLYFDLYSDKGNALIKFYKKLAQDRAKKSGCRNEYIESYRHLREHGNAFLILFCELILGFALFETSSVSELITILFVWMIPALPVWFIGSYLESKLGNV